MSKRMSGDQIGILRLKLLNLSVEFEEAASEGSEYVHPARLVLSSTAQELSSLAAGVKACGADARIPDGR